MLFHTPTFALFFAIFLACYLPVRRSKWGVRVIVVFSSAFYASWDWRFLPLLWVTIIMDFWIGLLMGRTEEGGRRKLLLATSLVVNLGILGYFKYWNFLVHSFLGTTRAGRALTVMDVVLPLGISFYIFQSLSYIIDVYRRKHTPIRSIFEFAAFVTFFPHLIAGPIQRIEQLVPQILNPDRITLTRVASGAFIFSTGLLRKSLGDTLASFHDPIFQHLAAADPAVVVISIFTFGLQIYLDFSGYSEMAVGVARVLGIDLMQNFAAPYLSASIRDYWRRWHISLSLWLRDYLYISLGGSRAGYAHQIRNLIVTMGLCGLWHGAGWNFVLWGLLHGVYLSINTLSSRVFGERSASRGLLGVLKAIPSVVLTYVAANYAWLYFRLPTMDLCVLANRKIWAWVQNPHRPAMPEGLYAIFLIVLMMDLATRFRGDLFPVAAPVTFPRAVAYGCITALCFLGGLILSVGQPTQQFIYFQF